MKNFLKNHKRAKAGVVFLSVVFVLLLVAVLFLKLWPAFGGRIPAEDRKDYWKTIWSVVEWRKRKSRIWHGGKKSR